MTQLSTLQQGQFLRGLNAVAGRLAQPKGSVQGISNMMYSTRGSLQTVDGDELIAYPFVNSPFTAVLGIGTSPSFSNYSPAFSAAAVVVLDTHLSAPTLVVAAPAVTAGGFFLAGSYTLATAAWDGNGGIGLKGADIPVTLAGAQNSISFTWMNIDQGAGIAVYWITGGNYRLLAVLAGSAGTILNPLVSGPLYSGIDTTEQSEVVFLRPSYVEDEPFLFLPASPVRSNGEFYVDTLSSYFPGMWPGTPYSIPNGAAAGAIGGIGPLPQVLSFSSTPVAVVGNTHSPMECILNSSGVITAFQPLQNTYAVAYPSWAASTLYAQGTVIQPATPNGHWYTAAQGGESGPSAPAFPTNGGQVAELSPGSVIWTDGGSTSIVAPRGAAHAISHASCLFLLNTSPSPTADGLDGPSVLAQSDVNNPNSWNPVNRTTIGAGDGQNGMGLASFSIAEAGIAPQLTLLIFKEFTVFVMNGLLPNAYITAVQTDMGCVAPRSIQFVEGIGVIRLTHKGFAVTDGIGDKIISDDIRPYLLKNSQGVVPNDRLTGCLAQSFQTVDPPMYCCSLSTAQNDPAASPATLQFNRLACFDTKLRCWTIVDLPFNIFAMGTLQRTNLFPESVACFGSLSDGTVHRWMNGDSEWDASGGTPIAWSVVLPPIYKDGTCRVFVDNILIAGSTLDGPVSLSVQLFEQGKPQGAPETVSPQAEQSFYFSNPGQFQCSVKIRKTVVNSWISISGKGRVLIDTVSWNVRPKAAGVPVSMMAS